MLTFADVACRRGGRLLFRGASFAVRAGDALVIAGPNGIGKSSLLRLAAGLLDPFAGTIHRTAKVALADEHTALDSERPLRDALGFWAGLDRGKDRLDLALNATGLAGLGPVPVALLSTGQRKRATLARVYASTAPLWLLDEPLNGLDPEATAALTARLALHRAQGGALLIATHLPIALPGAETLALSTPEETDEGQGAGDPHDQTGDRKGGLWAR